MDGELRTPVRFLNYNGDRTGGIPVGTVLQHPIRGDYFTVVSANYDPDVDRSRFGLAPSIPEDIPEPTPEVDPEPAPDAGRLGTRGPRGKVGRGRKR